MTTTDAIPADDGLADFTDYFCRNYPGPDTIIHDPKWHAPKLFRAAKAALSRSSRAADGAEAKPDWRDDPAADERWNAGLDYGMQQFCKVLGVDPADVTWDAATETLDGDVQAVICNILRFWSGDDWVDLPATRKLLLAGQGDDDGAQILPDFEDDDTVLVMVERCLHLLERRRDVIAGYSATHPASSSPDAEMVEEVRQLRESNALLDRLQTQRVIMLNDIQGVAVGGRFDGWLVWKHPDGQWVTKEKLKIDDNPTRAILSKHGGKS